MPFGAMLGLALLATLLASISPICRAGVVASSQLQTCVNDGSTPTTSLSCSQKIVVTVELENNKLYETEQLQFGVSCVNSPNDQCPCPCNYATDATCQCRDLQQNITVSATKTPVYASYPLTYVKYFNGRPYETVIVGNTCRDGENDAGATCGFAQLNGQDIPNSQGFCCDCGSLINFGGSSGQQTRGNLNCGGIIQTQKSAHCLRLDPNWWHAGFVIGEYALNFNINLNITTVTANSSAGSNTTANSTTQVLQVNPSNPFQRDAGRRVSAKLLGDLESYQQAPQLDGKFLMIPVAAGEGPQEAYSHRYNEWMVVDSSMVTLTGLDCDKIGVDYSGFRNSQPNACTTPRGSCLHNQIADLYASDVVRMNSGLTPQYFVGRYGGGTANVNQMSSSDMPGGGLQLSLNLPISSIKTSLMTLTVAADNVAFVINNSPAQILGVQVCTYDGHICGGFQALVTSGYLQVTVKNAGYVAADYTVTVTNCSVGVRAVQAQLQSIAAQASSIFQFELQMESDQALNNSCTVSVTDALGGVAASQGFSFYTNATQYGPTPDQSEIGDTGSGGGSASSASWCQQVCPSLANFKCALQKGCYKRLAQGIVAIVGPLAGVGGAFFLWRSGHLSLAFRILSWIFCSSRQAATTTATATAAAAAAAPAQSDGANGGQKAAKGKGKGRKTDVQQDSDGSEDAAPADGLIKVAKKERQGGAWQGLRVADEPPQSAKRERKRSSSLSRARDSILAAASQARDMLLGIRGGVASSPLAAGGAELAAAAAMGQQGGGLMRMGSLQLGSFQPGSPQALSLGSSPLASPLAAAAAAAAGSPFANAGLLRQLSTAASLPGSPVASPLSRTATATAAALAGSLSAAPSTLEQQLRQVQQQRQLLRQLTQIAQQQQQQQQDSVLSPLGSPAAAGTAGLSPLARTASAPAPVLAAAASAPLMRQLSMAAQLQQQPGALGAMPLPAPAQYSGFSPGSLPGVQAMSGLPFAAAAAGPVGQAQSPLLHQLSAPASMLQRQLSLVQPPSLPAIRTAEPSASAADLLSTPQQRFQLAQQQVELAALAPGLQPGTPGSQQAAQQASMRALGIPAQEAQQQHGRRPGHGGAPAKSRFAPSG